MTIFSSERVENVCNFFYLYNYAKENVRKAKNPIQGVQKKEFFSNFANFCEIKISKFCLSFPELPKRQNDLASILPLGLTLQKQ